MRLRTSSSGGAERQQGRFAGRCGGGNPVDAAAACRMREAKKRLERRREVAGPGVGSQGRGSPGAGRGGAPVQRPSRLADIGGAVAPREHGRPRGGRGPGEEVGAGAGGAAGAVSGPWLLRLSGAGRACSVDRVVQPPSLPGSAARRPVLSAGVLDGAWSGSPLRLVRRHRLPSNFDARLLQAALVESLDEAAPSGRHLRRDPGFTVVRGGLLGCGGGVQCWFL